MGVRRSAARYNTETVLGDCGHVCDAWPQVSQQYICDTCTREQYALDPDDELTVWVYEKKGSKPKKAPAKKPPAKRAPKKADGTVRADGLW